MWLGFVVLPLGGQRQRGKCDGGVEVVLLVSHDEVGMVMIGVAVSMVKAVVMVSGDGGGGNGGGGADAR